MKKIFYGWWIVIACFFIALYVGGVIFYGLTAFVAPLREEFGWSYTQISLASSLRGLEMGIFSPMIGILIDRLGPRKVIFWGVVTAGFGLMALAFTRSLAMFYGSFLLLAFGAGGCTSVALMSAVTNWFKRNVGKALGVMASGFGASGIIVPLIVLLIQLYGWRATLVILGLGMWLLGIPSALLIRNRPEQYGCYPDDIPPNRQEHGTDNGSGQAGFGFREALKHRGFLVLNLAEAIRMMTLSSVILHVMPYLSNMGVSRASAGLIAAAIPLVSITGRLVMGWMGDVMEKRHVLALSFVLMVLGMLAFGYVKIRWMIFLFIILFSSGFGGSMVLRGAILREYFGRAYFGKLIGITMGSGALGGIFGPTLTGWVFDTLGDYRPVWFGLAVLSGLTMVLIFVIRPIKGSRDPIGESP